LLGWAGRLGETWRSAGLAVAVSRGAYDAQLFTDSREKLGSALGHDVSHTSAHMPDRKPPQRELAEAPKQEKSQDLDVGLSL